MSPRQGKKSPSSPSARRTREISPLPKPFVHLDFHKLYFSSRRIERFNWLRVRIATFLKPISFSFSFLAELALYLLHDGIDIYLLQSRITDASALRYKVSMLEHKSSSRRPLKKLSKIFMSRKPLEPTRRNRLKLLLQYVWGKKSSIDHEPRQITLERLAHGELGDEKPNMKDRMSLGCQAFVLLAVPAITIHNVVRYSLAILTNIKSRGLESMYRSL